MTTILFFGGAQATYGDVNAWKASAEKQKQGLQVLAYPWPNGANIYHPLNTWPTSHSLLLAQTVSHINDDVYIVGHSSGCAYSNDVALQLLLHYPQKQTHLVCLDGFEPETRLLRLGTTQVWSAHYGTHHSLNYDALHSAMHFHDYIPNHEIEAVWGLHFCLVNKNANDHTTIQSGYLNCDANLSFLVPAIMDELLDWDNDTGC